MAITKEVTKVRVDKVMDGMFNIVLNLCYKDGSDVLITRDFTEDHRIGNSVNYTIAKFLVLMQEAIDNYKAEQNIFNSAVLDNAIITLENNLEG